MPLMGTAEMHSMDFCNEADPSDLLHLFTGRMGARVVTAALELLIFDVVESAGSLSADDLVLRLGIDPGLAPHFFGALQGLGLLDCRGGELHNTAESSAFLVGTSPRFIGNILMRMNDDDLTKWTTLSETLTQQGRRRPSMTRDYFRNAYERVDPEAFLRRMDEIVNIIGPQLDSRFDWTSVDTFVDIGGGRGSLSTFLAERHPGLAGAVFELPALHRQVKEHIAQAKAGTRIQFIGGDFFDDPIASADVFILGHILLNLTEEDARQLVAKLSRELPEGGFLIIYDPMIDDLCADPVPYLANLSAALSRAEGGHHHISAYRSWCEAAGLRPAEPSRLTSLANDVLLISRKEGGKA